MSGYRYLFLGGLHRSGTSILFKILRDHPDISGFSNTGVPEDEGQLIQNVYPAANVYGGPGKFGFSKESHLTETSGLITDENRAELFSQWSNYWDLEKKILLEKSPPNLTKLRFLQSLFPNSYFVVITRHPIATSLATKKWSKTNLDSLIEHWLICHEYFHEDKKYIKNLITFKYEDFIINPGMYLNQIYNEFGIVSIKPTKEILSTINDKYFKIWKKYRKGFVKKHSIRKLVKKYESRVQKMGYTLNI